MAETVDPTITRPRYEIRPSALRTENAPEEFVDNDAKAPTFGDMLDAINPLQQLPIVGSIYRSITGATISPTARVVGGVLFGGLAGGISAVANAVVEKVSGKDMAENLIAMVAPGKDTPGAPPGTLPADLPMVADGGEGEAKLQFASFTAEAPMPRGSVERGGLLTTWIPDAPAATQPMAPRGVDRDMRLAAAPPGGISLAALKPIVPQTPEAVPAPASTTTPATADRQPAAPTPQLAAAQAAAPPPMPAPAPEMAPVPPGVPSRGMSLDGYRARAINAPVMTMQMPAVEDRLGLMRRAEAARALTSQQATIQTAAAVPAALQAQQAVDISPQSYFAASMERGLERYRQMQLQREEAARGANGI